MINTLSATKKDMSQVWDVNGKRLPVTKFLVETNIVVGDAIVRVKTDKKLASSWADQRIVEIAYGNKKLKNVKKPLRARLEKLSLTTGFKQVHGLRELSSTEALEVGQKITIDQIFKVGDIVQAQGTTKGRGFAGGMKRHGFHGGPKTHGQSDRWRAIGSIGNRTTPGRVWLGQKMPGHYGVDTQTVRGLIVAHIDLEKQELWLTGPVPGSFGGIVNIRNTGKTKKNFALDKKSSGISETIISSEVPAAETEVATEKVNQ